MKKVPEYFRSLLWSYNFSKVDPKRDQQEIVINTVNYGDVEHWKWIANAYGKSAVRKTLSSIPATAIRKEVRPLAEIVFSVKHWNYAPRGAH